MRLSELAFESVRDSISIPNEALNYYSFTKELADQSGLDKNWSLQLASAFGSINLALARLQSADKIEHFSEAIAIWNGELSFTKGEIVRIVIHRKDDFSYEILNFRKTGNGTYKVFLPRGYFVIDVEYKKTIPHFDLSATGNSDWAIKEAEVGEDDENKDLAELNITDIMCSYIKEFVKGQCLEVVDPEMADMHNSRAEAYFSSIPVVSLIYPQTDVVNVQKGWVM